MTRSPGVKPRPIGRLLLATDLSARCDRALDRAAQLAAECGSGLVALHVLDPTVSLDQTLAWARGASDEQLRMVAQQQLARDLAASNVQAEMRIERHAEVDAAILQWVREQDVALVITGIARGGLIGSKLLGSTVDRLARRLPVPLLVVRNRPHGAYRRVVVASDFSEASQHALSAAASLLPGRELSVYHAHDQAMDGLKDGPAGDAGLLQRLQGDAAEFIRRADLGPNRAARPVIETGRLEEVLSQHVRAHDVDLVVAGSQGRSGLAGMLLGSNTARLLQWLPCDMLVVPAPRPRH